MMLSPLIRRFGPLLFGLIVFAVGLAAGPAAKAQTAGTASPSEGGAERDSIRALLRRQVAAWNRGDVEAFMAGYARTDSLRFASGGTVRRGWTEALRAYRSNYPDRAAMGTLAFGRVEIDVLSARTALAFGEWRVERTRDVLSGLFTLVLRRPTPSAPWRIVHDHTSSGD